MAAQREPIEPIPLHGEEDAARTQLGAELFNDVRLSHDRERSCASCHPLDKGGADGKPRATARGAIRRLRNTPTVFNVAFNLFFNWDANTEDLPAHDEKVLLNPALMATSWPEVIATIGSDSSYRKRFAASYPQGVTRESVLDALATFERSLTTPNAPFDRYLRGDTTAISAAAAQGYHLFKSYGCVACHQGVNVGGNLLQPFGVFERPAPAIGEAGEVDAGHFLVSQDPRDRELFRVPSLRNVALTAPYFHDGRAATLEAAVTTMGRVQLGIALPAAEVRQIVLFLGTLSGEYRGPGLPAAKLRQ
jgi:cytochrome c peroxidase